MGAVIFDLSLGEKTIHRNWTFKDIKSSDFSSDVKNRNIKVAIDYSAIQNSINNMFLFAKGERILQPEFGNSLYEYLYEPVNEMTAKKLGQAILSMFERWEPRVVITNIFIDPIPDQNLFYIEVEYTVPSIGNETLKFDTAVNQRR
jgi:phage baseplate assembly protein W